MARTPGETCKKCGRSIVIGFIVADDVWRRVVGDMGTTRCVMCFDEAAHAARVPYEFLELAACPWNIWFEE